jgi:uncharacterized protein YndB with AHSA1/START domain
MPSPVEVTMPSDREIRVTRVFEAPRALVWDCHTRPELMQRWLLGSAGSTMPVCEMDLRVGGRYRWVWRNEADGSEMAATGVHKEIIVPERIVATQLFDQEWAEETLTTVTLTESDGRTTLAVTVLYASKEARDGALQSGMTGGMALGYDRMETILDEQKVG